VHSLDTAHHRYIAALFSRSWTFWRN